jgi:hypothetical protein
MGKKDITFEMELDENDVTLDEQERDVALLLDELGELIRAEKMSLAFDDEGILIGVVIGTKPFVDNASEGVEDLFDLADVSPTGEGETLN